MKKIFILLFFMFFVFSCYKSEKIEDYKTPSISWESCKNEKFSYWFSEEIDENLLCSEFEVPLNYEKKSWEKITLALTKIKAKSEKPIWDLLIIAGWPWDSSLKAVSESFAQNENTEKIFENFNIIWYSPRWVFPSNPQINCWVIWDENSEEIMKNCIKNTWENILKNIWSAEASEDIEQIRIWLWWEKISVVSYSYWTKVLALYSEKYWQNLRAWVFDWVVDLNEDMFTMLENQEKWFQKTFENFAKFCLNYEECIFDEENIDLNKEFHKFLKNLNTKNLKDKNWNIILAYDFLRIFQEKIMWDSFWEDLIVLISELDSWITDIYNEILSENESFNSEINSWEIDEAPTNMWLEIINCADFSPKKSERNRKEYLEKHKKVDSFSSYDNFENKKENDYLDLCFYWPFDWKDKVKIPEIAKNSPQVVFVAQKFDPTTPYENALNMSKYFSSPLLTRNQNWHTLVFTWDSDCIDEKIVSYLLNPEKKIESETCEK